MSDKRQRPLFPQVMPWFSVGISIKAASPSHYDIYTCYALSWYSCGFSDFSSIIADLEGELVEEIAKLELLRASVSFPVLDTACPYFPLTYLSC